MDLESQQILLAAAQHNASQLRLLLRTGSANAQDPETGFTPLHAAIAACKSSSPPTQTYAEANGHDNHRATNEKSVVADHGIGDDDIKSATKVMKLLLENGAIWNDVDKNNETPGCLALRLGFKELYAIMVDAGVRAEILLNRLEEYEALDDGPDDDDDDKEVTEKNQGDLKPEKPQEWSEDAPAATDTDKPGEESETRVDPNSEGYLRSNLRFEEGKILDESRNGVMMAWEAGIMKRTADLLCPREGLRILNIGHGMGIIDEFFQEKSPSAHNIVEAHPGILAQMRKDGWYEKPNVTIHEGKWQDVVPEIIEKSILFDAIYFDTFAEDYKALRDFFSDQLIGLLKDHGKWGFFHGLGGDRQICYDVYTKVVEMDLFEAGFDTEWETIQLPDLREAEWKDVKRKYWALKEYKLPICTFTT